MASGGLICLPAHRIARWERQRNERLRRQKTMQQRTQTVASQLNK